MKETYSLKYLRLIEFLAIWLKMETNQVDKTNLVNEEVKDRTKLSNENESDSIVLKPSVRLNNGNYEILGQLGEMGGFGVTYLAYDNLLKSKVAIKEYFPRSFAGRTRDKTVTATKKGQKNFEWGYSAFMEEARTIANLPKHPNVIDVKTLFEENGTAYFVMSYEEGKDLESYIEENHPLTQKEIEAIIFPFLEGVKHIHNHDILHRDIKPANILITKDKQPILIDFGTARNQLLQRSKKLTAVYTEGYASLEQHTQSKEGTYTDIYAIGMLIYAMMNGITNISMLPSAIKRYEAINSKKISLLTFPDDNRFSKTFINAVKYILEIEAKNRPQSILELIALLKGVKSKHQSKKKFLLLVSSIGLITLLGGGYLYQIKKEIQTPQKGKETVTEVQTTIAPQKEIVKEVQRIIPIQKEQKENINYFLEAKLLKAQGQINKAIEYFKISVTEDENAKSAFLLGLIYESNNNLNLAKKWFLKAEELGNDKAKYPLAIIYCKQGNYRKFKNDRTLLDYAENSTKEMKYDVALCFQQLDDITNAKRWFEESSKMGYSPAIKNLYKLLMSQLGYSSLRAKEYIDLLGEEELTPKINYYQEGLMLLKENRMNKAIESFKKSTQNGNANAMFKLGLIYEIKKENNNAIKWYEQAKIAGNSKAQYRLGVLGCEMKHYEYLNDFEDYAKGSTKEIQYDLAVCFSQKGDYKNAKKWFKMVGNKGDAKALYQVAILSFNQKERLKYLKRSANAGYVEAKFELGKTLFNQRRFAKSKYWLNKASTAGSKKAKEYLKRMRDLDL